jgi:hypothetical protein
VRIGATVAIVDACHEERLSEFLEPFPAAGEVEVLPASTCAGVIARGGGATTTQSTTSGCTSDDLKQYYLGCLAHASYLIADEDSGAAAVVDPQRDIEQYLSDAERVGCRIRHVFLTHFHADFLAGHLELRDREGSTIHLGARASAEYRFMPMADGAAVDLGSVRLVVLETPDYSPSRSRCSYTTSSAARTGLTRC